MRKAAFHLLGSVALAGTWCAAANAQTSDYPAPKVYSTTPTGVNLSDGSFVATNVDLSIGTLQLERFYLGGYRVPPPSTPFMGGRFSDNFDIFVSMNLHPASPPFAQRYKPIVHIGASASGTYVQETGAMNTVNPSTADAQNATLQYVSGAYVYTTQDGTIYTFNPAVPADGNAHSQRVASIAYPDGRTLNFSYSGNWVKLVTDNSGYAIVFDLNADGTTAAACGFNLAVTYVTTATTCSGAGLKVSYGYTSGVLTSFTDVTGQTTTYSSDATGNLTCIQPPGYATCKVLNTFGNHTVYQTAQVTQQNMADGSVWKFQYG